MLLTRPNKPPTQPRGGGPLSTRGGTLLIAALLSLVAGAALLIFLRQYREDLTASDGVRVLVVRSGIPHGTTGEVIAERELYKVTRVKKSELVGGALTDPADLEGKMASKDLFPGHQLKQGDFKSSDGSTGKHLDGYYRAMSVPLDKSHGMLGRVETGDRVDVIGTLDSGAGALTIARVLASNVLVIAMPDVGSSGAPSRREQVTIRVPDDAVANIAAASDGGQVWVALRPAVGARSHDTGGVVSRSDGFDARVPNSGQAGR
jgi:Flp pilus assembly protein CpaB